MRRCIGDSAIDGALPARCDPFVHHAAARYDPEAPHRGGGNKVSSANTVRIMVNEERVTNAETQLASFFAKYEPTIAKFGKALRAKLRDRLPGLFEIVYVYENQDALVISYSPTEHGSEGLCGIALYPSSAKLFFGQGALLSKSNPNKLPQGRGKTVRHVVLNAVADFDRAEIAVLMAAALKLAKLRLDAGAKGSDHQRGGTEAACAPRDESSAAGHHASDGEGPALTSSRLVRHAGEPAPATARRRRPVGRRDMLRSSPPLWPHATPRHIENEPLRHRAGVSMKG
jgi:hypothetical protein